MYTEIIAGRLSELRISKGMTQEAVAESLGISNKTVSKWENCVSAPEAEYMPVIADLFGVTVGSLFGRDERGVYKQRRREHGGHAGRQ